MFSKGEHLKQNATHLFNKARQKKREACASRFFHQSFSITVSPLYEPQFGHTRCASLYSPQLSHFTMPGTVSLKCVRRLFLRVVDVLLLGTATVRTSSENLFNRQKTSSVFPALDQSAVSSSDQSPATSLHRKAGQTWPSH